MKSTVLFLSTVAALSPVLFLGTPKAKSTISPNGTTLYMKSGDGRQSSAQFAYKKFAEDSVKVGLATVYLTLNRKPIETLQTGFDAITQECSCYWLDANDLKKRFPKLSTNSDYRILISGPNVHVISGSFGIDFSQ